MPFDSQCPVGHIFAIGVAEYAFLDFLFDTYPNAERRATLLLTL